MGDNLGSSEIDKELNEFPSEISELFYDSDNDPEYIPTDNSDSEQDVPFSDHDLEDAISELPAASSVLPAASVTCNNLSSCCVKDGKNISEKKNELWETIKKGKIHGKCWLTFTS
ncbi:hypothetical protein J6590_008142 [Homalodisca vitripennis]|nr:hypothetical protein J6590_008142 [Homalodisca vitripennis]